MASPLHLPSLSIEQFRGLRLLKLPELGQVTLLAGANGIGKTTVLDAIRFYASRTDSRILIELIDSREEFLFETDDEGDSVLFPDFTSLFNEYDLQAHNAHPTLRISAKPKSLDLSLRLVHADNNNDGVEIRPWDSRPRDLRVSVGKCHRVLLAGPMRYYARQRFGNARRLVQVSRPRTPSNRSTDSWPPPIQLESLGPGLLNNAEVARLWDAVALTEAEGLAIRALRLVVGDDLERLAVVGDPQDVGTRGRRVVAKLASSSVPVPLKRLGDGANRLLSIAISLANCKDGILLLDEVENGIHYSIQPALWRMLFAAAAQANVQVVAATHSWDCIAGFAVAAVEAPAFGALYRIERFQNDHHAVYYPEEELDVAARQRIEVR